MIHWMDASHLSAFPLQYPHGKNAEDGLSAQDHHSRNSFCKRRWWGNIVYEIPNTMGISCWVVPQACFPPVESFYLLDGNFCIKSLALTILFAWHTHEKMEKPPVWMLHCFCECRGIPSNSGYRMGNCCHMESAFHWIPHVAVRTNSLTVVFSI